MSRSRNYSEYYSQKQNSKKEEIKEEKLEEVKVEETPEVNNDEVEFTIENYGEINNTLQEIADFIYENGEEVETDVIFTGTVKNNNFVDGEVCDCGSLNVRLDPDLNSSVLKVLQVGTKVKIDLENSNEYFYKVHNLGENNNNDDSRDYGYCLKKYIKV